MKRHASLVPLSRDHHHGLVMAERLILGRSTNPSADWPEDRAQQAERLIEFFETDLRAHFEVEETDVFPVAARDLHDGADCTRALTAEHETMRAMIRDLATDSTVSLEARLAAFGELLKAHIRREERVLFEQMQSECEPGVLEKLGARIAGRGAGDAGGPGCRL